MSWRKKVGTVLQILLIVAVLSMFLGHYFGQPILLSFVETGSMEPQAGDADGLFLQDGIQTGYGFIAIPSALTDSPETGDVVVFEDDTIHDGELTTHRIVDETEQGYITAGDANPFTDQEDGEEPVQEAQIKAEALQFGGQVVTIPHLGTAVMTIQGQVEGVQQWMALTFGDRAFLGTQGLAFLLFGLSMLLYVLDTVRIWLSPAEKERSRSTARDDGLQYQWVVIACALLLMGTATMAMVVPGGTEEYAIVSAEFESEDPTVIEQGSSGDIPYIAGNGGLVPAVSYFESETEGLTVDQERALLSPRDSTEATVTIETPDETGLYMYYFTEHRYLALLPLPVIDWLYNIHPWLPIIGTNVLLGGGVYAMGRYLLPAGRARLRTRSRSRSTEK